MTNSSNLTPEAADRTVVSYPRELRTKRCYMLTKRTFLRTFFLRPDSVMTKIFGYCLAVTAQRFGIFVIAWVLMSNHYHAIVYDEHGLLPRFLERFHRLLAMVLKCRYDLSENVWSTTETSVVYLPTRADVFRKVLYVLSNPLTADLVERAADWEGASSLEYLDAKKVTRFERPRLFFSEKKSTMPDHADLQVSLPPIITDEETPEGWARRVRDALTERENSLRITRKQQRRPVLGWAAVISTSHLETPSSLEKRGQIRPTVASEEREARIQEIKRLEYFREQHEKARKEYVKGNTSVVFPEGTYRMRLLGARCEPLPAAA